MRTRTLGETTVSEIGLSVQDLAGFENPRGLLEAALAHGVTYFHATDVASAEVLLRELGHQREHVLVGAPHADGNLAHVKVRWFAPADADEAALTAAQAQADALQESGHITTHGYTLAHLADDEQLTVGRWAIANAVPLLAITYSLHEPGVGRELFALASDHATRFVVMLPKETTTLDAWLGDDLAEIVSAIARTSRQLRFLTESGRSLAQTAIKFALAQPTVGCVLPAINTVADLQHAVATADAPDLTRGELNRIDDLAAHGFHLQPFEPTSVYNG